MFVSLLLLSPFIFVGSYYGSDENLSEVNNILSERFIEFGVENALGLQENPDKELLLFKRKCEKSMPLFGEVSRLLQYAKNEEQRVLVYGIAAISCMKHDAVKNGLYYLSECKAHVKRANPTRIDAVVLEIVDKLADLDIKEAQVTATDLLFSVCFSSDQIFMIYKLGGKRYSSKYLMELTNDSDFKTRYVSYLRFTSRARIIGAIDGFSEQYVLKYFKYYSAIDYSSCWRIWKKDNYVFPLIAYIYYCGGNKSMYEKYKALSLSPEQLSDMRGAYFEYIEYASKVFCLTNDTEAAISLMKSLPNGHRKNLSLKRVMRYLTRTKEALLLTLKSGLLPSDGGCCFSL